MNFKTKKRFVPQTIIYRSKFNLIACSMTMFVYVPNVWFRWTNNNQTIWRDLYENLHNKMICVVFFSISFVICCNKKVFPHFTFLIHQTQRVCVLRAHLLHIFFIASHFFVAQKNILLHPAHFCIEGFPIKMNWRYFGAKLMEIALCEHIDK